MKDFLKIFVPVGVFMIACWFLWWGYANSISVSMADRGQLGDLFGGANALFSGLALAGVVTAVILQSNELAEQRKALLAQRDELRLQREQLSLQREELILTRTELSRSAKANEETSVALSGQLTLLSHSARINGLSSILEAASTEKLVRATQGKVISESHVNAVISAQKKLEEALDKLTSQL